jgi:thiopurine S-methyltransferase
MEPDFWLSRWREGQIAFHEPQGNENLHKFAAKYLPSSTVLVPLCGKTADMALLAALGHRVLGVELVEAAAIAFFEEQAIVPERSTEGGFVRYCAGQITLLVGDFFALTAAHVAGVSAIYDRAALIALPLDLRVRYTAQLAALLGDRLSGLMIVVDYTQSKMEGPPFAISDDEFRQHYPERAVSFLAERASTAGRLAAVGAVERAYWVESKAGLNT